MLCPLRSPTAGGVGFGRAWTSSNDGGRSEARQRQSCAARVRPQAAPATCRPRAAVHGLIRSVSVGFGLSRRRQSVSQVGRTAPPARGAYASARSSARRRVSRGGQKWSRGHHTRYAPTRQGVLTRTDSRPASGWRPQRRQPRAAGTRYTNAARRGTDADLLTDREPAPPRGY